MTLKHDYDKDIYNYEYIDEIIRNKKRDKKITKCLNHEILRDN